MTETKKETVGTVLRGQKDWKQWYTEVKAFAELCQVWEYMNPELDTHPKIPKKWNDIEEPEYLKGPDGTIQDQAELKEYRKDVWKNFSHNYARLYMIIRHSVDSSVSKSLWESTTPYELLKYLWDMFHRTDEELQGLLISEMEQLSKRGIGNKGLGAFLTDVDDVARRAAKYPSPYPDKHYVKLITGAMGGTYPELKRSTDDLDGDNQRVHLDELRQTSPPAGRVTRGPPG